MGNYTIGLNAISTAKKLMDVAGDNVANANSEGYHAKRAEVAGLVGPRVGGLQVGLGSTVQDVFRMRDRVVEAALLQHIEARERLGQEVETLSSLESLFAELTQGGLDSQLGQFFDAVESLSADPSDRTLREQVVQKLVAVCDTFNRLDEGFVSTAANLQAEVESTVQLVNSLTEQIAYLNGQIRVVEAGRTSAAAHKDERDQLVADLAELVNITIHEGDYGVVNVTCSGTLIVDGVDNTPLALVTTEQGPVVTPQGSPAHHIDVREGQLGGLMSLAAERVPQYHARLDELAGDLRRAVNLVHATSLGLEGRFQSLQGLNRFDTAVPFAQMGWGVASGTAERLVINVEDTATGELSRYELSLDTTRPADAFLADLRDTINADVEHVTASVDGGRIALSAEDGYAFGFATRHDPNPAGPGDITAVNPTEVRVVDGFSGEQDLTFEVNFLDGGAIGQDTIDIGVTLRDRAGTVVSTFTRRIDSDYVPGQTVVLDHGLRMTLGEGNVESGDGFSFMAHASMDTAGVLDALGLNSLLNGRGAGALQVAESVRRDNASLAGALTPSMGDNHGFLSLAEVRSEPAAAEGESTLHEAYRALVSELSTTRNTKAVQHENQQILVKDLLDRRDAVSGVSIDEEMVNLVRARTLYEGAIKYITVMDRMLSEIANMV